MSKDWIRVTRQNRCPVCNHDSWCTYNEHVVLCMRVQSNRPKTLSSGEVGYFHPLPDGPQPLPFVDKRPPPPQINVAKLLEEWSEETTLYQLNTLSQRLCVTTPALGALGASWAKPHNAWAFPMRDGYGNYTGIRLRSDSGKKWAVPGSHSGIFYSPSAEPQKNLIVTEGPTDCAAAMSLGYYAVGRPSCSGGMQNVIELVRRLHIPRVVIVADADDPGINGANMLAEHCQVPCAVIVLPAKDIREFVTLGGTKELVDSIINQAVWRVRR